MRKFIKQKLRESLRYSHVIGDATKDTYQITEENNDFGYHAGELKRKSGLLSDSHFMPTLKSQLGTGHFFFGDINDAKYLAGEKLSSTAEPELATTGIFKADFSKYNLFKPSNASEFYDNLIITMIRALNQMGPEDVEPNKEGLIEIADYYRSLGVNISDENFLKIVFDYLSDMDNRSSSNDDNLNTRIMKSVGFEGVDLRGTEKDGISKGRANVGSVIFDLKPGTIEQI
jgi:hypothetical protein